MAKSNLGRASARRRVLEGTRLYWIWAFCEAHGYQPGVSPARDALALADIVFVQCAGDAGRSRQTIDEIVGEHGGCRALRELFERYLRLLWWYDCGRPRAPRRMSPRHRAELHATIKRNLREAATASGRRS